MVVSELQLCQDIALSGTGDLRLLNYHFYTPIPPSTPTRIHQKLLFKGDHLNRVPPVLWWFIRTLLREQFPSRDLLEFIFLPHLTRTWLRLDWFL